MPLFLDAYVTNANLATYFAMTQATKIKIIQNFKNLIMFAITR